MRLFYILAFLLLTALHVKSQSQTVLPQEPDAKHVKFYPNPATSIITFDFLKESDKGYFFQVFNFLGRKVHESLVNTKTIINLSDFTRGIYIFQLKDPNGRIVESGKFQVNK
jgi:hypothetical protein